MRITELLKKDAILLGAEPKDKNEAIDILVGLHAKVGNITDKAQYKAGILEREEEGTTAIGEGIAIPHSKNAAVKKAGIASMTVPAGVDYDSMDGEPSNLFFMIAAPKDGADVHLDALARLSTLLMDTNFRTNLLAAKNADEYLKVIDKAEKELNFWLNNAIKGVTEDGEKMQFNTAIARMMEFINALSKYVQEETKNLAFLKTVCESFIKILAPFAPHFAEEQWSLLTGKYSVFNEAWPTYDAKALVKDEVEIAIQVNGKIKNKIMVSSDLDEEGIKAAALADEKIIASTEGKTVVKVIVIKGRLVNIVVK